MKEIPELLQTLHFKYVEAQLAHLMEEARIHSFTYDAFLRRVLSLEVEARTHTAHQNRRKAAHLPESKTLEAFDFSFQPSLPRNAQRDGRRAKPELMSESWSELDVPPVREGRNSEMESKKGRREKELSNSQEKKP